MFNNNGVWHDSPWLTAFINGEAGVDEVDLLPSDSPLREML